MSLKGSGSRETPSDLTRILKKVRAALEDRKSVSPRKCETVVGARENGYDVDVAGNLDDIKEAFGACQSIEWKEQEYRYLRSKVVGHRRRDVESGPYPRLLGSTTLPPIHRSLLRSVSTPDAPQLENRSYKSFLRHRRASLGHESEVSGSCGCGTRDTKGRRRRAGVVMKDKVLFESESEYLHELPSQICAKIVSYVKSSAWTSRESLLSAASRSLDSSDEDSSSVILNPSEADDEYESGSQVLRGVPRSVSEETLIYRHESPVESKTDQDADSRTGDTDTTAGDTDTRTGDARTYTCDSGHPLGQTCASCPKSCLTDDPGGTSAGMASVFDSIPHIDSSEDEEEAEGSSSNPEPDPSTPQEDSVPPVKVEEEVAFLPPLPPPLPPLCQPEDDSCSGGDDNTTTLPPPSPPLSPPPPPPPSQTTASSTTGSCVDAEIPNWRPDHTPEHTPHSAPSHTPHSAPSHTPHPAPSHTIPHQTPNHITYQAPSHTAHHTSSHTTSHVLGHSTYHATSHTPNQSPTHTSSCPTSHISNHAANHISNHTFGRELSHPSHATNHTGNQSKNSATSYTSSHISSHTTSPSHTPNHHMVRKISNHTANHEYNHTSIHHTSNHTQDMTQGGERVEDEVAAAITGGVTSDGRLLIEVFKCPHPDLASTLALCCHLAHAHAYAHAHGLPPPRLLLLIPAEAFTTSTQLLHILKEQAWTEVRVWAVARSPGAAARAREVLYSSHLQVEVVGVGELERMVVRNQLTSQFGGTLHFDIQAWRTLSQLREDIIGTLRPCVSRLESWLASPSPLNSSTPSPSSTTLLHSSTIPFHSSSTTLIHSSTIPFYSTTLIHSPTSAPCLEEVRQSVTRAKSNLRDMESCCQRFHKHSLVKWWVVECREFVETVEAVLRLVATRPHLHLPPSPRSRLTHRANTVVAWLLGRGEETLARHQTLADTLTGITRQEAEFQKFYTVATRHLEKGGSLLQETAATGETEASVRELAGALHLHLTQFTDRLHHTRDRLEDTARCYHLLDKAYEWALEAMKVVGRVKGEGLASPEQVGAAARTLTAHLEEHPPIPDHTFVAMTTLATRLNNHTLLQQCKMAQVRCQETSELLRTRQAALQKAKRQMEFDCQSYVDLGDLFGGGGGEEQLSPLAWLAFSPLNASGRRKSVSSIGSRPREPLSRCPSLDTDDDSVFLETPPPPPPTKAPLEARTSLGGIKEVRESAEDLQQTSGLSMPTTSTLASSTVPPTTSSSSSSGTSGTSSCSSSDSSGPVTSTKKFMKRANTWQYGMMSKDDDNSGMDDGMPQSPTSHKNYPPSSAVNSHLLIRGSQLNLSFNTEDLSQEEVKKSKTLLLIMRELIQTERDYVNALEYIIEDYIPELMREDIPQALRGQRNVVFGNIEKIYEFHSGYFLRALEACEMQPFTVGSIFLRYESQFYLYALYNKNKPKSDSLMSEYGSAFFRNKQLEFGDKMDLASYLLKPVQRMGKYALILKQLLKECGRGEESHEDLQGAQEMVQFQLRHGNDLLAMDSLRDCDVNLKEQGRLLRQGEFLVWEGSRAKKAVRHVFLFEDLILFSKARRDPERKTLDIFQYKHSMKMTDIGLTEQVGESISKFEIWFRKRKPSDTYLLQAATTEMKESWTEEISKLLWRQALRNRTMRLHEMSSMGIGNKPCLDIRPSEDQISDRSISINQLHKAPRLRAGSICGVSDMSSGGAKRPHSIISVSSSSASSSASSASSSHSSAVCPTYVGSLNLGFEAGDSPRALHRSVTRTSQCSAESGILADMYSGGDDDTQSHRRVERSNSTVTTLSVDSALSPASSTSPVSSTSPTSPTSPFTSPISPLNPASPLTSISSPRTADVIYEAHVLPPTKDSSAETLLTTEV